MADASIKVGNSASANMFKHILKPKSDEVFYHYCSTDTFLKICESKALRFSDINLMNDVNESAYGYEIFEEGASTFLDPRMPEDLKIDRAFFDDVDQILGPLQAFVHPLICSFSKNPDVLSQWRAYADNGRGVAVGFSGEALLSLPATILNVEYGRKNQISEMAMALAAVWERECARKHSRGKEFVEECREIAVCKAVFKNPYFAEEQEVRCMHLLSVKPDGKMLRLSDDGGMVGKKSVKGQPVKFRVSNNYVVGYIDLPLLAKQPIKEVWLGPKNDNAAGNLMYMMSGNGLMDFEIYKSRIPYR